VNVVHSGTNSPVRFTFDQPIECGMSRREKTKRSQKSKLKGSEKNYYKECLIIEQMEV
jgi:hypothetical protein